MEFALLSPLVQFLAIGTNHLELCQRRVRLGIRKRIFTKGWSGLEQAPQSSGHGTGPVGIHEVFGQCSQTYGLIFGCCFVEPGVGLSDPYGSLPTRDAL